jgi:hypothetical protein
MSECDCCGYDGTDLPRYRGMMQDVLDNLVKKRTAELEAREEANRAHHVAQIAANDRLLLRIAELEKVAEAAEATYKIFFWDGTKPLSHWEREYNALRTAGYLGAGG